MSMIIVFHKNGREYALRLEEDWNRITRMLQDYDRIVVWLYDDEGVEVFTIRGRNGLLVLRLLSHIRRTMSLPGQNTTGSGVG